MTESSSSTAIVPDTARQAAGGGGVGLTLEMQLRLRTADGGIPGSAVWLIETEMSAPEAFALYPAAPLLLAALEKINTILGTHRSDRRPACMGEALRVARAALSAAVPSTAETGGAL